MWRIISMRNGANQQTLFRLARHYNDAIVTALHDSGAAIEHQPAFALFFLVAMAWKTLGGKDRLHFLLVKLQIISAQVRWRLSGDRGARSDRQAGATK
jgi:hypothetical protein